MSSLGLYTGMHMHWHSSPDTGQPMLLPEANGAKAAKALMDQAPHLHHVS